jgi:hypothetical protein
MRTVVIAAALVLPGCGPLPNGPDAEGRLLAKAIGPVTFSPVAPQVNAPVVMQYTVLVTDCGTRVLPPEVTVSGLEATVRIPLQHAERPVICGTWPDPVQTASVTFSVAGRASVRFEGPEQVYHIDVVP